MNLVLAERIAAGVAPCQCERCREMCSKPCWPTLGEARALIALGYARRLMVSHGMVIPALHGLEGRVCKGDWLDEMMEWPMRERDNRKCTFYQGGKCELHDLTYQGKRVKPLEARIVSHDEARETGEVEDAFLDYLERRWRRKRGLKLVQDWKAEVGVTP